MSALLEIQKEIDIANERVADLEIALRDYPGDPSIAANLDTAVRIQKKLQAQFMEAAAQVGVEVCRYRAFKDNSPTAAGPAMGAISSFQKLFSIVFASLKYGARQRARVTPEIVKETAMQLRFAFTGSLGVVLTVPSDADLFDDSYLDDSLKTIFAMAKADTPKAIFSFAERLGPGAINALHQWVEDNAESGMGADIEWRRGPAVRGSVFVQRQELSKLRNAIDRTSSPREETIVVEGMLDAVGVSKRRFTIKREGFPDISGSVEPGAIDRKHTATLPRQHRARILKTTRLRVAAGTQQIKYHLLGLTPVKEK